MRHEQLSIGQLVGDNGIVKAEGTEVPSTGTSGYAPGCLFIKTDATLGAAPHWVNVGSYSSCKFVPTGPRPGYGFYRAGGTITSAGGDTTETITVPGLQATTDISIVGHSVSDDNDQIVAQIVSADTITITAGADPLTAHGYVYAVVRQGAVPEWDVFAAGTVTSTGGSAAEAITISGALTTDIGFANYSATDDTDTISKVVMSADTMTITCSADPGTTHGFHYCVLRPAGTFKPSHYVAYAGVHTTTGGSTSEAITISGVTSSDVAIVTYAGTDDTDTILKSVLTTDTLTVTMSADPGATHKIAYVILRAY
jgi:hypothetical protein